MLPAEDSPAPLALLNSYIEASDRIPPLFEAWWNNPTEQNEEAYKTCASEAARRFSLYSEAASQRPFLCSGLTPPTPLQQARRGAS